MTPREPEPSDVDRPPRSSRRDHRDRDRGDPTGYSAGDEPTTGQHRIPDDLRDYRGSPPAGRADGAPPAPRRRRGTPPTLGLPVPPPPITKELVSDDAPHRASDLPASDGLTGNGPVGPTPSVRRRDRDTAIQTTGPIDGPRPAGTVPPSQAIEHRTGRPNAPAASPDSACRGRPTPTPCPRSINRPAMAATTANREPTQARPAETVRPARRRRVTWPPRLPLPAIPAPSRTCAASVVCVRAWRGWAAPASARPFDSAVRRPRQAAPAAGSVGRASSPRLSPTGAVTVR